MNDTLQSFLIYEIIFHVLFIGAFFIFPGEFIFIGEIVLGIICGTIAVSTNWEKN